MYEHMRTPISLSKIKNLFFGPIALRYVYNIWLCVCAHVCVCVYVSVCVCVCVHAHSFMLCVLNFENLYI